MENKKLSYLTYFIKIMTQNTKILTTVFNISNKFKRLKY